MHLYPAAVAWVAGGAIGFVFRVLLWVKFDGDLAATSTLTNGRLRRVATRSIESTLLHLTIKAGVIAIGITAMFRPPQQTAATQVDVYGLVVTVVLITIPWILAMDAIREYAFQNAILGWHNSQEVNHAAGS